jgi:hypothetical protein
VTTLSSQISDLYFGTLKLFLLVSWVPQRRMELGLTLTHLSFIFLCKQVVHAARSRILPERGTDCQSTEQMYESGRRRHSNHVVCWMMHLINAYGWSKGQVFEMFRFTKDVASARSRKNPDAKPDIITCNSVLNACAFEDVETAPLMPRYECRGANLEDFQSSTPTFGRPTLPTPTPFVH